MRPPKPISCLALFGFLLQTSGCYSVYPLAEDLPTEPGGPVTWRTVVVTQEDGRTLELREPWKDSLWVGGEAELTYAEGPRVTQVQLELTEVERIEEKRFNRAKTIGLVALSVGLASLLPLVVADVFKGRQPGPGPGMTPGG
jgi:hypothetical protein